MHLQQVHCNTLHQLTLHQAKHTALHYTILHLFAHQQVLCTLCALCRRILRLRNLRKVAFIATLTAHPLHPELYCRLPPSPTCHQAALCLIHISREQTTNIQRNMYKDTTNRHRWTQSHRQPTLLLLVKQLPKEFSLKYPVFRKYLVFQSTVRAA